MQDPVQNRRIMGIGRVNLVGKIGRVPPDRTRPKASGFAMAPDRKRGYGLLQQIGRYEFWAFDLEQKKLLNRTEFDGRPRMALRVSSNGRLLYVFQAGATIDVYEAATYRYLRTIEMNADQTTNLFILPKPSDRPTVQRRSASATAERRARQIVQRLPRRTAAVRADGADTRVPLLRCAVLRNSARSSQPSSAANVSSVSIDHYRGGPVSFLKKTVWRQVQRAGPADAGLRGVRHAGRQS